MATEMKTIKFSENGETYVVNGPAVQVSGELTESATTLDFGTFEDGLSEVDFVIHGVEGTSGDYIHIVINGTKTSFTNMNGALNGHCYVSLKRVANGMWQAWALHNAAFNNNSIAPLLNVLKNVDKITSLAVEAYSGSSFAAGTRYAMEGR